MFYVIRVCMEGRTGYVFDSRLLVENVGFAKKFYSLTYARRYIKTHSICRENTCEIIISDELTC